MRRHFLIQPSAYLALFVVLPHLVVMAALSYVALPKVALFSLLGVLVLSMVYYLLRDARLVLGSAWLAIKIEDDHVLLVNRKGEELIGQLLRSSVVTPYLVLLNVLISDSRRKANVVLMADSMGAEDLRQLRVMLGWKVSATA
jgi:hypothetical protein